MTVLTIFFFRLKLKNFVKNSFPFENAFFARAILDLMSFLQCSIFVIKLNLRRGLM